MNGEKETISVGTCRLCGGPIQPMDNGARLYVHAACFNSTIALTQNAKGGGSHANEQSESNVESERSPITAGVTLPEHPAQFLTGTSVVGFEPLPPRENSEAWRHTCVHHNDSERVGVSIRCPICVRNEIQSLTQERDAFKANWNFALDAVKKVSDERDSLKVRLGELKKFIPLSLHPIGCIYGDLLPDEHGALKEQPCTCGLEQLKAALLKEGGGE